MNNHQDSIIDNDPPLPSLVVRKFGGWYTKAQNYPTFSPIWFRYRAWSFVVPLALFGGVLAAIAAIPMPKASGGALDLRASFRQRRLLKEALILQELERAKVGRKRSSACASGWIRASPRPNCCA